MAKLGPTRTFPRGKISEDDEGALTTGVTYDPAKNIVIINYGYPVAWVGMPPQLAKEFAETILKHAAKGHSDG